MPNQELDNPNRGASSVADMVPSSLSELLAPFSVEDFFSSCWGYSYKHIKGWNGKFSTLMPWSRLNEILRQQRLEPPRIRLAKNGEILDSSVYIEYHRSKRRQFIGIPRLLPNEVTEQLRQGATLILDAADELYEPITHLAESLEHLFHVRIQVNIYAGWRSSHGFDIHWDDHDVFILQVAGRKKWKVYPPTRVHPLAKDIEENKEPPKEHLWENTLEDGDCLYIPRGWWHVAMPLEEPTLHLTIGIHNPTGVDLLHWLVDQLRSQEVARQDLPRFLKPEDRAKYMDKLIEALTQALEPNLLDKYFTTSDAMAAPRARFSFPWSAMPSLLPPSDEAQIQLIAPRPLDLTTIGSTVEFACNGKLWQFATEAKPILNELKDGQVCTIAYLCSIASNNLDRQTVRAFLTELVAHGLITIIAVPETNQ